MAGHDTTSNALASAICLLSLNPDIQQRARDEAISILGDEPEDVFPTVEDTKNMEYINQIIKEVHCFLYMNDAISEYLYTNFALNHRHCV